MPDKRSFLQKAFMDPPKRPNGDQPWDSLTQEEKDALLEQAEKDRLYGRNSYEPSYLAQGMKSVMEALGPKPEAAAKVPEAKTWNQHMDTQAATRAAQAQARTFTPVATFPMQDAPKSAGEAQADALLNVKKAKTIEEKWQAIKNAQQSTTQP